MSREKIHFYLVRSCASFDENKTISRMKLNPSVCKKNLEKRKRITLTEKKTKIMSNKQTPTSKTLH